MVSISQDETTASAFSIRSALILELQKSSRPTRVVPADSRLHNLLHPSANSDLLSSTEEMRSLAVVDNLEAELSDVDVWIRDDAVATKVDEALDLLLL